MDRALLAVAMIAGATLHAAAQSSDTPGLSGGEHTEGLRNLLPAPPPPYCQHLLAMRDQLHKHGQAITTANEKKADLSTACRLFHIYVAAEARLLKALDSYGALCGASSHTIRQVRDGHAKVRERGEQVCQAARRPFRPDPPVRDDILIPPKPMPRREPWPTRLSAADAEPRLARITGHR
jgi:hypothetical protein